MEVRELQGAVALDAVVTLLRRRRAMHPTWGLWEAADFCWWWRVPRATDDHRQLFWFEDGAPVAAAMATQWGDRTGLDPLVLPDATDDLLAEVVGHGIGQAEVAGFERLDVRVDDRDDRLLSLLLDLGFVVDTGDADAGGWLEADERPDVSPLAAGYRLVDRSATATAPHHLVPRSGAEVEHRLLRTPLYRPDLDLVMLDAEAAPVAYGLFWLDSVTRTGLVEPMRTEEGHEGRGLARHVLTAGVDRLARAGADRVRIAWALDNPATCHLYPDVGFVPATSTVLLRR